MAAARWSRSPKLAPDIDPGVRLLAEGSEDFIGHLPSNAPALNNGDTVVFGPSGGTMVTYKIEAVRYVAEYSLVESDPTSIDRYAVYGRTDYIVSVVP